MINQDSGQADPVNAEPINFEVVFSEPVQGFGAEAGDVDLSARTTPGTLTAAVTGGPTVYNVAVSGMTGDGEVIATIPAGAAQRPVSLEDNVASSSVDNVVTFLFNDAPTATNLDQSVVYASGASAVSFDGIEVSDADEVVSSAISTVSAALVDHPAVDTTTNFQINPFNFNNTTRALGASWEFAFTPEASDLTPGGGVGSENRRLVFEIGGSSNGSGFYLLDGNLYFAAKMNTNATMEPTSLNDTDWGDTGGAAVFFPLTSSPLPAGEAVTVAAIFDLDSLRFSVNGSAPLSQALTGRGTQLNWTGDESISIGGDGPTGGPGGLSNVVGSTFRDASYLPLASPVSVARLFNVSGTDSDITRPVEEGESITATLTLANPANGSLSATSGNGETYDAGTGVWTVTGDSAEVTAALSAVQFETNANTGASESITVSIDDGDEDGSPAVTGTIVIEKSILQQWRIDNFGSPDNSGDGANLNDANGNGLPNILDFLYGFNPTGANSSGNSLEVENPGPGGVITQHGGITFWADPDTGDVYMRYPRRADYLEAGLTVTDQFSRDLVDFEDALEAPEVIGSGIGDDGVAVEAVQIKLPLILPVSGGKARFGRNEVDTQP
jgi:hypothetical protein